MDQPHFFGENMGLLWNGTTRRCGGILLLQLLWLSHLVQVSAQGRIVLSEFMIDPLAAASKFDGTYIELYNAGDASIDLLNQQLLVNNFYATFATSVIVPPKTFAVIANSAVNTSNGGLPYVSYVLDTPSTWQVSGGRLLYGTGTFSGQGWTFSIDWGGNTGRTLPWTPGASISYNTQKDPNFANTTDHSNWCVSVTRFGSGSDKGTPGASNVCVLPPPTRPPTRRPTTTTRVPTKSPTKTPSTKTPTTKAPSTKAPSSKAPSTKTPSTKAPAAIPPPVPAPQTTTFTKAPTKAAPTKRPIRRWFRRIFG
jgi:Lamin Tail Domain